MSEARGRRKGALTYVVPDKDEMPTYVVPDDYEPFPKDRRGGEHYWQTGNMILTRDQFAFVFAKEVQPEDMDQEYGRYLDDVWT